MIIFHIKEKDWIFINQTLLENILNQNSENESESLINSNNHVPIHYAIEQNSVQLLELLLSKGADINAKNFISPTMNYSILIMLI